MTSPEMIRCKKCSWLVVDDNGNWICDECNKDIHIIKDEDCPCEDESR